MSATETENSNSLGDLRSEIDRIDDRIHDLIMERAAIVERIRSAKGSEGHELMQPAREAQILRRLVERHKGPLPAEVIVHMWRQMIPALIGLQMPVKVAVFAPELRRGFWDIARDHFGSWAPMVPTDTPAGAVRAVSNGEASVAVVPWPEMMEQRPWWTLLLGDDETVPRIVGFLPFLRGGNARSDDRGALCLARVSFRESGDDNSMVVLEFDDDVSRSRLMDVAVTAGLKPLSVHAAQRETPDQPVLQLVEFEGYLAKDDPRLNTLLEKLGPQLVRVTHIGGYAAPISFDEQAAQESGTA